MSEQNLSSTIESLMADFEAMSQAGKVVRDKGQSIVVNLLWMVSEGHTTKLPTLLDAFQESTKRLKLERKGFELWVYEHVPVRKNKDGEWLPVGVSARKAMVKARKAFREEYDNDYWLWVVSNVKVEKAEVDWMKRVDSALKSAKDKGGFSQQELMLHIVKTEGLDLTSLIGLLAPDTEVVVVDEEEEQEAA